MNAEEIKKMYDEYVDSWANETLMRSIEGATLGVLTKACRGSDRRHAFLKALTNHSSSKELNLAQIWGLYKLVQPDKIGGHWTTQRGEIELESICETMIASLDNQPGQLSFIPEEDKDTHLSFEDDLAGYEPPF